MREICISGKWLALKSKMGRAKPPKNSSKIQHKENMFISRKRKAVGQPSQRPFKMLNNFNRKSSWSLNSDESNQLIQEMGCKNLSENSNSTDASSKSSDLIELTPAVTDSEQLPIPGAPRISLCGVKLNNLHTSSDDGCDSSSTTFTSSPLYADNEQSSFKLSKSSSINNYDYFTELSDEIILQIFRWLPKFCLAKCAKVCRRWNCLVTDDSLWKRLDLSNKTLQAGNLGNVLGRGVQILRLTKAEIEGPLFTGPAREIKSCRLSKVQYLDLSMSSISVEMLEELLSICRDLKKLSLEHCQLSENVCQNIGENKELQVLNVCMCQGITAAGLMPIASHCRKLEALNLAWTGLHRHSVVYLSLCLPPSVQKLNISGCRENVTDEEILQLVRTCPNLKELDLSDSTVLTCASITHIANHLINLEYLALSRCYRIQPTSIVDLNDLDNLRAIDVFGMLREGSLQQLKESIRNIEINKFPFSSIARPTTGIRRTSIWGLPVRDNIL